MKNRKTIYLFALKLFVFFSILIVNTGCFAVQPADTTETLPITNNMENGVEGTYSYDGGKIIITKNKETLYAFDSFDDSYRKLDKVNDTKYTAGSTLLTKSPVTVNFQFESVSGKEDFLKISKEKNKSFTAIKETGRTKRAVTFYSGKVKLSGDLYLPNKSGKFPAVVLVHGSGAQDRNGYLNLMALMAEKFVNSGIAVLTYDKRGAGESEGNWKTAGFDLLANDTVAAMDFLKSRDDIHKEKMGLWGSSQAGWVMAEATSQKNDISFVIAVSAAGIGITPAEQNLYYLEQEMKQRNVSRQTIADVLAANKALYDLVKNKLSNAEYKKILNKSRNGYQANWWLPPSPESIDWEAKDEWFMALDVAFDTDQIWKNYKGSIFAVFGANDTLTPTDRIVSKLKKSLNTTNKNTKIEVVSNSNHILMTSRNTNTFGEFADSDKFGDRILTKMVDWANEKFTASQIQK